MVLDSAVSSAINSAVNSGQISTYIIVLAVILFIPFTIDTVLFYATGRQGAPSIVRSTMALSLIFILGAVIFHLIIVVGINENNNSMINNLLSILTGGVTAIIGFHFGGASARQSALQEMSKQAKGASGQQTGASGQQTGASGQQTGASGQQTGTSGQQAGTS